MSNARFNFLLLSCILSLAFSSVGLYCNYTWHERELLQLIEQNEKLVHAVPFDADKVRIPSGRTKNDLVELLGARDAEIAELKKENAELRVGK